jgi:hypothetical protein
MAKNANDTKDIAEINKMLPYPLDFESDIAKYDKIINFRIK